MTSKRSHRKLRRAGIAALLAATGGGDALGAPGALAAHGQQPQRAGTAPLLAATGSGDALGAPGALAAHGPRPHARASGTLKATDTAHLRYISASGSLLIEEGRAAGTLPGSMKVHFDVGATFSGSFTIYAKSGAISGHGSAVPHGSGTYESFVGSLTVTGGSGRYAHAHGQARLYGTFNRDNYALVVQTVGTLRY